LLFTTMKTFMKKIDNVKANNKYAENAQSDYLKFLKEREDEQEREASDVAWKRRVQECAWLLDVTTIIETKDKLKEEAEEVKSYNVLEDVSEEVGNNNVGFFPWLKGLTGTERARDEELVRKEAIAKLLIEQEEKEKREVFLGENAEHIVRLDSSIHWMKKSRLPAHHQPVSSKMSDHVEPPLDEETEWYREKNLSTYERWKPTPHVDDPRGFKTSAQVKEEDRQARLFQMAGRYHNYTGAHRLYPLMSKPKTAGAIFPSGVDPSIIPYPEKLLLPDPEEVKRRKAEAAEKRAADHTKVTTVRDHRLNFSRQAVRLNDGSHFERGNKYQNQNSHSGDANDDDDDSIATPLQITQRYQLVDDRKSGRNLQEESFFHPSEGGLRESFVAENSMRTAHHMKTPMERHRGAKQLDVYKIKGLKLISRRTKENRQRVQKMEAFAAVFDVSIGAGGVGGNGGLSSVNKSSNASSIRS
jgi:hypothetical protein